jgi:DNA-binding GntR family transcriptional regulator
MATGSLAGPAVVLARSAGERSLSQQVYDHLVEQIIHGQIKYGDTLNIKAMARQFGVSAMPIRDAIKRLETENIVAVRPRSNCYIRRPTAQTMLQAVESREMLELFAVGKACSRATRENLAGLRRIVERMTALVEQEADNDTPMTEYVELDHQFHAEICRLAGNEYLERFYRETSLHLSMRSRPGDGISHGMRTTCAEHREILQYLETNSPEVVAALQKHLAQSRQNVLRDYDLEIEQSAPA